MAIRPFKSYSKSIIKNLEINSFFTFYNDYFFFEKYNGPVDFTYNETVIGELYSKNNLDLNVSAVVGKNGSGKSALFEFFYSFC